MHILLLLAYAITACGIERIDINRGWCFKKGVELRTMNDGDAADIPHSWNIADAMFGGNITEGSPLIPECCRYRTVAEKKNTSFVSARRSRKRTYD